ncbi:response regulator transcription factor, partial [Herbiconiux sp.]|uniref:response regulator n=1 Tax=Herbiconiux sp. TaxID=1871186 RepID=UPI0025C42313
QELFAYGMRMLVESQTDLEFAGSARDGAEALDLVAAMRPDVVLMDIRMPVLNGLEATRRLTADGTRVVVLTTFQQEEAVVAAMRHGASAFVTKDVAPEVLLDTIRRVHAGDAPPEPVGELVKRFARPEPASETASAPASERVSEPASESESASELAPGPAADALEVLSPREREIYLFAATGLRNRDIARAAFVSEATVKTHIRGILAKLGFTSRAQIVVHAYENGLLGG